MESVNVYMFEMNRIRETDPQGFTLMIIGVSLIAFLALTIFGGFMYYLYRGHDMPKSKSNATDNEAK